MLVVSHQIKIGSDTYSSTDNSRLIELHCSSNLAIPVNECRIVMTYPEGLSLEPGDDVEVELGYEGETTKVFTGQVESVDWSIDRVTIYVLSAFRRLVKARFNLFFEKPKAGDIVSDVASELEVSKGSVDNGLEFASYALGNNKSVYDHLKVLAQQCGFDLYADESDELQFTRPLPLTSHAMEFGADIISLSFDHPSENISGLEVFGASPASFGEGADASSWLTKKEVKGVAGSSSGIVHRIIDPTARTQENAIQIATAMLDTRQSKTSAKLKALGNPKVKMGEQISIASMPLSSQNGTYKVTGVNHKIHYQKGYTSIFQLEQ